MPLNLISGRFNIKKGRKIKYFIFRSSFTDKNGIKHFARDYKKKAFVIPIYE